MAIYFFSQSDTHRDFSNFASYPIDIEGERWATTEHYYQAQKFMDPALQAEIRNAEHAAKAKRLANKHKAAIRPDWDAVKDDVMYRCVRQKFAQHASMRELLLSTGDEDIVENAPNDYYWGVGRDGTGRNMLGCILMRLRNELRKEAAAETG
jgi:ribA/ribD-fused uncharacterized protein